MEDPIFDPWGTVSDPSTDDADPAPASAAEPSGGATPTPSPAAPERSTPPPPVIVAASAERPQENRVARWTLAGGARGAPAGRPARRESASAPEHATRPDGPSDLREVARPAITALAARLEMARHRTRIDDRLDRSLPAIRFQLIPFAGPFDEPRPLGGPALEVTRDEETGEIVASIWSDPLAESPSEERRLPAGRLTRAWIDRLLLHFVQGGLGT